MHLKSALSMLITDPHYFHSRAEELRTMADNVRDAGGKASLMEMAEYYDHLAQQTENRVARK